MIFQIYHKTRVLLNLGLNFTWFQLWNLSFTLTHFEKIKGKINVAHSTISQDLFQLCFNRSRIQLNIDGALIIVTTKIVITIYYLFGYRLFWIPSLCLNILTPLGEIGIKNAIQKRNSRLRKRSKKKEEWQLMVYHNKEK